MGDLKVNLRGSITGIFPGSDEPRVVSPAKPGEAPPPQHITAKEKYPIPARIATAPIGNIPESILVQLENIRVTVERMRRMNTKGVDVATFFNKLGFTLPTLDFQKIFSGRDLFDSLDFNFDANAPISIPNVPVTGQHQKLNDAQINQYALKVKFVQRPQGTAEHDKLSFDLHRVKPDKEHIGTISVVSMGTNIAFRLEGTDRFGRATPTTSEAVFKDFFNRYIAKDYWLCQACGPLLGMTPPLIARNQPIAAHLDPEAGK